MQIPTNGWWEQKTRWGVFRIVPRGEFFSAMFEDEDLGQYYAPWLALEELVGGFTFMPSNGLDTSECGLPDELSEWTFVPFR